MELVRTELAMGTRFEVILRGDDGEHLEAVAVAALEEIARLDRLLSRYDRRSEIRRINSAGGVVRSDRELHALLTPCALAGIATAGACHSAGGGRLLLDPVGMTVGFADGAGQLDLGGVGKGYALDRAGELISRYGYDWRVSPTGPTPTELTGPTSLDSGLLHGGTSSVLAIGRDAWPIDLRHPDPEMPPVARIGLAAGALSCSAVSAAARTAGADIFDWRTGIACGVRHGGSAACYVLAPEATGAEILSTALLVMGREQAIEYLDQCRPSGVRVGWFDAEAGFGWIHE